MFFKKKWCAKFIPGHYFIRPFWKKGKKGKKILKREEEGKGRKEEKDEKESYGWQKKGNV